MNDINSMWNSRLNRFTGEIVMYLSTLQYQIKYVISESHGKISCELPMYIIIFYDVNYLRVVIVENLSKTCYNFEEGNLSWLHSVTQPQETTTIFLTYKTMTSFKTLLQKLYKHKQVILREMQLAW